VRTLHAASIRHLLRHPAQLALALIGLTLGVGTIVAVDIATASSRRAFELSLQAINGAATHQLTGGPQGIDETLYVRLRTQPLLPGAPQPPFAPLVSGYVLVQDRLLQLIGIDPFASAELAAGESGGARATLIEGTADARRWFTQPGSVLMSARTAFDLRLADGARFELEVAGVQHAAQLIGRISDAGPGFDGLLLTDIAQAQEWLGADGRLSRIDVRLPPGAAGAALLAALHTRLPAAVELHGTRAQARETFAMTDAFTTNLRAMSLLALLVGTFLIYGAVSFAVLQRRTTIGVLRALGATRAEVLRLILTEAAVLGLIGAVLGILLGVLIGRGLVALVSRTINDLYFVVAVNELTLPAATLVKALLAALGTALVAAFVPALEVAASTPQLGLARSVLEARAQRLSRRLSLLAVLLAALAAVTVTLSARSLFAGFLALFLLLLAVAALTPAALKAGAELSARLLGRASPVARLALQEVAGSLSRTGVAIAALGMALTAMIGVAVMVESFRASLGEWLLQTLRADVYVTAPGPTDELARRLEPQVVQALLAVPGVRAHSEARRVVVGSDRGALDLNALRLGPQGERGFRLTQGQAHTVWPAWRSGALLISEPLAWRLGLNSGDTLTLTTASGPHAFLIAGVYREYGNDRGEVLMELATYRHFWGDEAIGGLGIYLEPQVSADQAAQELRAAARGRQALFIRSNAELRALSMRIFERTFVITRVLYWLAAGVAAIGLVSALLAWQLERARELALLRTLGVTPWGSARLVIAQTLFMGAAAFVAAIPAGLLTALVLTEVINRRAFGWQIDLHLSAAQFTNALVLALAAALAAALYPAWRSATAPLAAGLREE
jgi:putative ABC transport system permease protein